MKKCYTNTKTAFHSGKQQLIKSTEQTKHRMNNARKQACLYCILNASANLFCLSCLSVCLVGVKARLLASNLKVQIQRPPSLNIWLNQATFADANQPSRVPIGPVQYLMHFEGNTSEVVLRNTQQRLVEQNLPASELITWFRRCLTNDSGSTHEKPNYVLDRMPLTTGEYESTDACILNPVIGIVWDQPSNRRDQ